MVHQPVHPGDIFSLDNYDVPAYSLDHARSPSPPSECPTTVSNDNNVLSAPQYVSNGSSGSFLSISAAFGRNTTHTPFRLLQENHGLDSEHIVLFTMICKSGKSATVIQQGAAFLSYLKTAIPAFLSNRSLIYDNFSLAVRQRMFDAIPSSVAIDLPKVGSVTIAYVAMLASTVLEAANGSSLVSTLSWTDKDETHIMDVIKFSALQKYLDEAAEAEVKAARADIYSFDSIKEYDEPPVLSSIYDE